MIGSRFNNMSNIVTDTLVKHAFKFNKLKSLNMNWYRKINVLSDILQSHSNSRLNIPSKLRSQLRSDFKQIWEVERQLNRKLKFYNVIKETFEKGRYMDLNLSNKELKRLSQLRMSSHKRSIET